MRIGFRKVDLTPRVGVEMCGFGFYLNRRALAIRDQLWARAMAVEQDGATVVVVSNDLIGVEPELTAEVRRLVTEATGLPGEAVMVHCTHTHSGPTTLRCLTGMGAPDEPYMALLPRWIAQACIEAVERLEPATLSHAEVPCLGIAINREYDRDAQPLKDVLCDEWRADKPELADTTCHVLTARAGDRLLGFVSYFGCHPVVCCAQTTYLHGDYAGVATNL
ncbi:MAG TPA: neutral/alkaline non-lysosomal ceramidase N-terminal domain-containing protein, partial [Armatimonadota bacterium]|nr:neutral/alkaline non-lysosomal ceramidase N-terminal domain-containing protein [Armatimonadota bacterium]